MINQRMSGASIEKPATHRMNKDKESIMIENFESWKNKQIESKTFQLN